MSSFDGGGLTCCIQFGNNTKSLCYFACLGFECIDLCLHLSRKVCSFSDCAQSAGNTPGHCLLRYKLCSLSGVKLIEVVGDIARHFAEVSSPFRFAHVFQILV